MKKQFLFLLVLLAFSGACDERAERLSARAYVGEWPTQRELWRNFREGGELVLVYGTGVGEHAAAYREWCTALSGETRRTRIIALPDTALSRSDLRRRVCLLIGTPRSNRHIADLSRQLPLSFQPNHFEFAGRSFGGAGSLFQLGLYPSPVNRQLPVLLLGSYSDEAVLSALQAGALDDRSLLRMSRWGYAVYEGRRRVLLGVFDEKTWRPDRQRQFDFSAQERMLHQGRYFEYVSSNPGLDTSALHALTREGEADAGRLLAFTGHTWQRPLLRHHLYGSMEDKGLLLENTDRSHSDHEAQAVHTIAHPQYAGIGVEQPNQALLRCLLGSPATLALERGLAVYFTGRWQRIGYAFWAQRLHLAGLLLPLAELLDNEKLAANSPLLGGALSASFVEFLIDAWGRETFLQRYADWQPAEEEIRRLETQWHQFLARQPALSPQTQHSSAASSPAFFRGFNFTHEGYQIYNGYGSSLATRALERLDELHVNAVNLVPYSWMEDPRTPSFIPVVDGAGSENDASIVHAAWSARRLGMTTFLKPHLWLGRGSWPGDVEMQNEGDWQRFFEYYSRWIAHYAMLAEAHGMDYLCIGTELSKTTLQREAEWRRLIGQVRRLYSGRLTYAANWGEEFEELRFWDALDLIGLDCYYPLSKKAEAGDRELQAGFQEVLRRIDAVCRRYDKPMIFTEIGFSSVEAPWQDPHLDGYDRPANGEHQARCYQIVLQNIADRPWCRGLFWWKWPTDPDYQGHYEGKGFPPNGKPAEKTVAEYYQHMNR